MTKEELKYKELESVQGGHLSAPDIVDKEQEIDDGETKPCPGCGKPIHIGTTGSCWMCGWKLY